MNRYMGNPKHSMTKATTPHDNNTDSSDLLSMLDVIEQLYGVSRMVISSHSATAVILSLAVEVQTLLTKLKAMRQRWTVHLPFKEASSVDFIEWGNRMKQLSANVKAADSRNCLNPAHGRPSCHCLLDLYQQAAEASAGKSEEDDMTDPIQLLKHHTAIQAELTAQRKECMESISLLISGHLAKRKGLNVAGLSDLDTVRSSCSALLAELSEELFLLHEQQVKLITPAQYERLAERILFETVYEGQIARREARDFMHNWRNGVPAGKLEESRQEQMEKTKEEIRHTKHGVKLEQYVNLDGDFYAQRSEFGKFLFNRRRDITRAELRQLIYLVYCVLYFQTDAKQEAERLAGISATAEDAPAEGKLELPVEFKQTLRDSQPAVDLFYKILRRVEPYINKSGASVPDSTPELCDHYRDWGWYHLLTAFEQLDFLPKNSSKSAFSKFINSKFPHRTDQSVYRDLYRNSSVNDPNIVADVVKEFEPVKSLI